MGRKFGYWMQAICGFEGRENFPVAQCRAAARNAPACTGSLLYQHSRDGQDRVAQKAVEHLWNNSWGQWPWGSPWRKKNKRDGHSTLSSLSVQGNGQGREDLVRSNVASMGRNEMVEVVCLHQQEVVPASLGLYYKQALQMSTHPSKSLGFRSSALQLHERVCLSHFD